MAVLVAEPRLVAQPRPAEQPEPVAIKQFAINPWIIALTVTLATFMELLDTSMQT